MCSVHRGMFSKSGEYHEYIVGDTMSTSGVGGGRVGGGRVGEISLVHQRDTMTDVGKCHEYIGGCSLHRKYTISTSGDIMIHVGGVN